uniref:DM5 domain-containing protein n=1 Tax=Anopheles atroparvus TaxID=41427 RepID=A0A182ISV0_ANOAO
MRVFVVFAAYLALVTAAPQGGFAASSAGASAQAGGGSFAGVLPGAVSGASAEASARGGQVPVTVEYVPPSYTFQAGNDGISGINGAVATSVATAGTNTGFINTGSYSDAGATSIANGNGVYATANAKTDIIYAPAVVSKNFFYHIAQEDAFANASTNTLTITPRKHYKVIFIKAPSASASAEARARAASKFEEKTIVYVLVNKPVDAKANATANARTFTSRNPEVYFIKYQGPQAKSTSFSSSESFANLPEQQLVVVDSAHKLQRTPFLQPEPDFWELVQELQPTLALLREVYLVVVSTTLEQARTLALVLLVATLSSSKHST